MKGLSLFKERRQAKEEKAERKKEAQPALFDF